MDIMKIFALIFMNYETFEHIEDEIKEALYKLQCFIFVAIDLTFVASYYTITSYPTMIKEVRFMNEHVINNIKLNIEDARKLVKLANDCDFDVNISCGHILLDAKSILGVMALDFRNALQVSFYGDNPELISFLEKHAG